MLDTGCAPCYSVYSDIILTRFSKYNNFVECHEGITLKQIVKAESEVPKSRPKGLGLTLKSHGPPTPSITFKHEGVLW